MPNIKISALPPAALPLDDPNTLFEVTVLEAGLEVSRKITLSEIAGATGLDASFLTLSVNAQLPNERVLTEGTGITFVDTGPNGTLTINASGVTFPLLAPDGTAAAPSYSWSTESGTGIHLIAANLMGFSIVGTTNWEMGGLFQAANNAGPAISNVTTSATVPGLLPAQQDPNTGIGSNTLDQLSLIAGGAEIARATAAFNANQFAIIQSGSSSVPELTSLADPDTGFRWPANNQTVWIGGGTRAWNFSTAKFFSQFSNGPALMNEVSQRTNPTLVPDHADENTGIGSGGGDELSIIAGGVEAIRVEEVASFITVTYFGTLIVPTGSAAAASVGFDSDPDTGYFSPVADSIAMTTGGFEAVRWAELSSQVIQTNNNQVGLTASVTQTQAGGLPLLNSYNEIATVGTTGDALTAFAVVAGTRLIVINNGANNLQLFPAVGDDIGAGVDTAITIAAGELGIFLGRDATNWDTLYNAAAIPSTSVSFPLLAPDGLFGAPSYSFSSTSNSGMYVNTSGNVAWSAAATRVFEMDDTGVLGDANSPTWYLISDIAASATDPVFAISNDNDTGLGTAGADILSIIARGTEIARAVGALGANQFVVAPGAIQNNLSAPDLGLGDGDTGIMQTVDNTLALVAGANQAVRYAEASAQIVQTNNNLTGLTASVTQTQAGGLALTSSYNEVATVATEGDALTAFAVEEGTRLIIINNGANGLQLFPAVGDDFGAGVDASITIAANSAAVFIGRDSTNWDQLQNQAEGGSVFQGLGTWRYRTEITSPPSSGQVRFNNADPTLATEMFLHETNSNGTDVNNFLNLLTAGSLFYIQDKSVSANFFIVEISTNTDNGTDRTFGIANITLEGAEPNQNTEVIIVAVEAGQVPTANDVAQARRTTDLVLTTAFVDVTLDTTDVETDSAVLDHDLVTNTDNIIIGVTGTYKIGYEVDIDVDTLSESLITADGRVRLNDGGVGIPGSDAKCGVFSDGSIPGDFMNNHLSQTFYVNLTSGDFVTLQLEKVEISGTDTYTATRVLFTAERCL